MKKEIRNRVVDFRKKEESLIIEINKNPDNSSLKTELMKLRNERKKWLNDVGGFSANMLPEDVAKLENMVSNADRSMSKAARTSADVVEYISECAKHARDYIPGYQRRVDDMGQIAAIAEDVAISKVKELDKFNKKRNHQSFLNVIICKFKRPKTQEQSNEAQGPSK